MKRALLMLGLLIVLVGSALAQFPAPVYDKSLTPLQYKFGPFVAVSPFNNQPGYSTITNTGQIDPGALVQSDNTFTSTANFNVIEQTSPATTFTVASNVGTITSTAGSVYLLGDSATSFSAPYAFLQATVVSNGDSGSEFGLALSNSAGSTYVMADMYHASQCTVVIYTGGSYHNVVTPSCSLPSAPWRMGLSLVGNDACFWMNAGAGWVEEGCGSVASYYNFATDGNLSGFSSAIRVVSSSSTPWEVSNLITGGFGGVGVRDVSLVTYPDGRPYMQGPVAYFTATTLDPKNSGYDGVYSYNVSTATLTQIGAIWDDRSGTVLGDEASGLIYNPTAGTYRYLVGGWGNEGSGDLNTYYASFAKSALDFLANGVHVVTGAAVVDLPGNASYYGWDAHMACTQWNYSTGSCPYWVVAYSIASSGTTFWPAAAYSTSDPSANSWTSIGSDQANANCYEGGRILRSRTTSSSGKGVTYYLAFGGNSCSSSVRATRVYNDSMAYVGTINASFPAGAQNAPHPQIFTYGNSAYAITFNDSLYGLLAGTMGQVGVATAPRFGTQTNWPTLTNAGSAFSSSSSVSSESVSSGHYTSTFTVNVGDLLVGACRGSDTSETSATVADSLGNPITSMALNLNGSGFTDGFYGFATVGGTDTFTCTLGAASQYVGLTVEQISPGFLTTVDYTGYANQSTSSSQYVSSAFSTTAPGLVIACPDALFSAVPFQPGLIGPYLASFGSGLRSGSAACEGTLTTGAQTGITASMASGTNAGTWGGVIMSFK